MKMRNSYEEFLKLRNLHKVKRNESLIGIHGRNVKFEVISVFDVERIRKLLYFILLWNFSQERRVKNILLMENTWKFQPFYTKWMSKVLLDYSIIAGPLLDYFRARLFLVLVKSVKTMMMYCLNLLECTGAMLNLKFWIERWLLGYIDFLL